MCDVTRRGFLVGCSAAIAALAGSRFNNLAFAQTPSPDQEVLVVVFLRGGMDGLNLLPVVGGADRGHYETARPNLAIPVSGPGAALPLAGPFGLHPEAAPLLDLYQDGRLAIVHATGHEIANRSHFESMEFLELGTPGIRTTTTGWLTRHLQSSAGLPDEVILPSVSLGGVQQASLRGDRDTVNMSDPGVFRLNTGPWAWRSAQRTSLRRLYQADSSIVHVTGVQALDAVDVIELYASGDYVPSNGAVYPEGSFGDHLQVIARMIKLQIGLHVATLDLGGWDTHANQEYPFNSLVGQLAQGLAALYADLDGAGAESHTQRLTVVVQSEFGRRFAQNADNGCDHGHGNPMLVLSGTALGGLHGVWPGLAPGQLFEGLDLAVTTDYRRVLSEILIRRLGNNRLGVVFPGYSGYTPMGVVSGPDLEPDYTGGSGQEIFSDGFESGDLSAWEVG
ncbi:MAG: DUF1501 domain-containing protein [Thermoanaerobaculia bacterium]|nr:DUF1501 domain-containing protein [Thermoanaerobaculia bacterium]